MFVEDGGTDVDTVAEMCKLRKVLGEPGVRTQAHPCNSSKDLYSSLLEKK